MGDLEKLFADYEDRLIQWLGSGKGDQQLMLKARIKLVLALKEADEESKK